MPRPRHSIQKVEQMRNRIIDAAFALLEEVDPEEISIRLIAERVGVSHMVFYTYFNNRDALIQALIEKQQEHMNKQFAGIMLRAEQEKIHVVLLDALRLYLEKAKLRPKGFQLLWLMSIKHPEIFTQHKNMFQKNIQRLADLIQIGMDRGEFIQRDTFLAALTILSIVAAPLILHHLGRIPDKKMCDQIMKESLDAAMQYLSRKKISFS
ncbi:MAG TPA: TetR/AcrR family transcriptional regulator [Anaerolineae bacterium]|nr:TetR/AcrR family transcriptional regulator [Anaerolineae bacterium]